LAGLRGLRPTASYEALNRRSFLALTTLAATAHAEGISLPSFRIAPDGWGNASAEDMSAVVNSAMKVLWPYFPKRQIESFVITHVETVPMVHYERTLRREIIMDLATSNKLWSQLAYQFAHEFCHILCNFDQDSRNCLWFEETICETASLFTLRKLSALWKKSPPYPNWQDYAPALAEYADTVVKSRTVIAPGKLAEFYQTHAETLKADPTDRALNGSMSIVLLDQFERTPQHWEAVTWLNSTPSPPEETFPLYLKKWLHASPPRHQQFIAGIIKLFGLEP
jgi:hypothetical protein